MDVSRQLRFVSVHHSTIFMPLQCMGKTATNRLVRAAAREQKIGEIKGQRFQMRERKLEEGAHSLGLESTRSSLWERGRES